MIKELDIENIIPVKHIEKQELFNIDNLRSIAFKIVYPEVFLQKKNWFSEYQVKVKNFMKLSPDYTVFQYLSLFSEDEYMPDYENVTHFLEKSKQFHFAHRPIPYQQDYIIVTFANQELPKNFNNHILKSKYSLKKAIQDEDLISGHIENIKTSIETSFIDCKVSQLDDEELKELLYKFLSLDYNKSDKNLRLPTFNTAKNKIGDKHIGLLSLYAGSITESYRQGSLIDPKYANSNIKQVKDMGSINQSQIFPVTVGLPFEHAYSCVIQKLPVQKVLSNIDMEERSINLPVTLGFLNARNKKKDLGVFKHLITEHNFTPSYISMSLMIFDKDKTLLDRKMELAKGVVSNINDMSAVAEDFELPYIFFSNCPGNANQIFKRSLETLINSSSFIPKESHYLSDNKGFYVVDRFGKPFLLNFLDYPTMTNKNGFFIGASGRGKSYAISYFLSLIYSGSHLMIMDKGGSFKNFFKLFDGKYYDSADEKSFSFALFECEKDKNGNYILDGLQLNYVKTVICFIWRKGEKLKNEEEACLVEFIELYYKHINKTKESHSLKHFVYFIRDNWNEFETRTTRFFDLDSFLLMTKKYITGSDKHLFNGDKNLDLTYEPLVGFDMKAIEKADPEKFNLLCVVITYLSIKKIQRLPRSIFKSFWIDEALGFLKAEIGDFIGDLFAEFRKENGQVVLAAQGIKYFLEVSNEVKHKLFANRDFIVMTNHAGYENSFEDYKKHLDFSDKDIELLKSVRLKEEVLLRLGNKSFIIRLETSPEEDAAFTTTPKEMVSIEALYKETGSMQSAIVEYTKRKKSIK